MPRLHWRTIEKILRREASWLVPPKDFRLEENAVKLDKWARIVKSGKVRRCGVCFNIRDYLEAHHLFYKSFFPKLAYNPNNGIAVCELCHLQIHGEALHTSFDVNTDVDVLRIAQTFNLKYHPITQ